MTCNLKSLIHYLWHMVSNSARRELYTVTNQIILISQDVKWVFVLKGIHSTLWHRKWIMRKLYIASLIIFLEHWVINNPTKLKYIFFYQVSICSNFDSSFTCQICGLIFFSTRKK